MIQSLTGQAPTNVSPFSVTSDSTEEFYDYVNALGTMQEDGTITLPDGETLNVKTISGASVYTFKINMLSAHNDLVQNVYNVLKSIDSKLGQMISG